MPAMDTLLDLYLNLAAVSEEQGRPLLRDKFLALSVGVAHDGGFAEIAADCRARILHANPSHLFKNFSTVERAMHSEEVRTYLAQLTRAFPFEKAEFLLERSRSAGFAGHHEYKEIGSRANPTPVPPNGATDASGQSRARRRPTSPAPDSWGELDSLLPASPPEHEAAARRRTPAPAQASRPSPSSSLSVGALRCWILFAFAVGIAIGLAIASLVVNAPF